MRFPGPRADPAERRRSERNYSDLFGCASPMSKHVVRRSVAEASSPFGNAAAASPRGEKPQEEALVYRPHSSALMKAPKGGEQEEQVLPMTPRTRRVEPDQEVRKKVAEERACWDTKVGMDSGAEISRRRRDRALQRDASGQMEDRARSASQRKRMELGSRGLRCGMGATPAKYEDDNASTPGGGIQRSYSTSPSPVGGSFRSLHRAPHSARARKLSSLQSTVIF